MLKIKFGEMPEAIYNTSVYFKNTYLDEWLSDPFVKKMIKSVDKSEVLSNNAVKSVALGLIPPTRMSQGVKTLILIYKEPYKVFNASPCGDNCAKWILQMSKNRDITINLHHIMDFGDDVKFEILILNNQKIVHSMAELVEYAGLYV